MAAATQRLTELLMEAHSNELALINVLSAHEKIAEPGGYRTLLESHLRETRDHAERLRSRLEELGERRGLFALGYGFVQTVVKQGLVVAKGPIDAVRGGTDRKEKMLRNAMDEVMTEAFEIASYDALESLARRLGDARTAELAVAIREDEVRMFDSLRAEIPGLASAMLGGGSGAIPVEEPWPGYDDLTVEEIRERLADASESLLSSVRNYERRNKNRATVIRAVEREPVSA